MFDRTSSTATALIAALLFLLLPQSGMAQFAPAPMPTPAPMPAPTPTPAPMPPPSTPIPSTPTPTLPLPDLEAALSRLPISSPPAFGSAAPYLSLPAPPTIADGIATGGSQPTSVPPKEIPFASARAMILQFTSTASANDVSEFLDRYDLTVVQTYPLIGAIKVAFDLHAHLDDAETPLIRRLLRVVEYFEADPIVHIATPDLLLHSQDHHEPSNLLTPTRVMLSKPEMLEHAGWGLRDIEADQLWAHRGAWDGVVFAALDVGFHRHEDIVFSDIPENININDHGNHVAGIACAQHNDLGIKGVLPHCFVQPRTTDFFFLDGSLPASLPDDNDRLFTIVLDFMSLFGQVIGTLNTFVGSADRVAVLNLSLGYNWRQNFGIDPSHEDWPDYQRLVERDGTITVSILQAANDKGIFLFSAAGNDSSGLEDPLNAIYASPFNWAAVAARKLDSDKRRAENGVIVEAHDSSGRRAEFSNIGGHISCPGVDIISTLALGPSGQPAESAYGEMSGTSMAAPHCAAGYQLLRLVRPKYSGTELMACMLRSSERSTSGAPMLRLSQAAAACPPR